MIVKIFIKRSDEICEYKRLWVLLLEVFHKILSWESFLGMIVADKFSISLQVLFIDKSVSINALTLVNPKSCEIVWLFYGFNFGFKETLEDIGQVTNIELIVEVNSSLPEISFDFILEIECCFDHTSNAILDSALEFSKVRILMLLYHILRPTLVS